MRILVVSDSHSARSFMCACVDRLQPDAIIHLGDYYEDGQVLAQRYPHLPVYQVPGNCDRYRVPLNVEEIQIQQIFGVKFYMTHGHRHGVKQTDGNLRAAARLCGVDAVLYGHTHRAECWQEESGLWVLNPGACGSYGGSCGLITLEQGRILDCRILHEPDLP